MTVLHFIQDASTKTKPYFGTFLNKSVIFGFQNIQDARNIKQLHENQSYIFSQCVSNYKQENFECIKLQKQECNYFKPSYIISEIDLDKKKDIKQFKDLILNSDVFISHTHDYISSSSILSLQGIKLESSSILDNTYDEAIEYLNSIYKLS
jgi:hypothetical protein